MTSGIKIPCMLIIATRDPFLPPKMAHKIKEFIPHCQIGEIDATHWLMVERPMETNAAILNFFESLASQKPLQPLVSKL
jgi:soluble epoxide hydrolase/lipid-phosphate phosphatase